MAHTIEAQEEVVLPSIEEVEKSPIKETVTVLAIYHNPHRRVPPLATTAIISQNWSIRQPFLDFLSSISNSPISNSSISNPSSPHESSGSPVPELRKMADYTWERYMHDAALIKTVYPMVTEDGRFSHLSPLLTENDKFDATAALRILRDDKRQDLEASIITEVRQPTCSVNTAEAFTPLLERFRRGSTATPSPQRDRGHERDSHSHSRHRRYSSVSPEPARARLPRLKARDLELTDTTRVTSYLHRLVGFVTSHGEAEVLALLPQAMIGKAQTCYDGLFPTTEAIMYRDIREWYTRLLDNFQQDRSLSLQKADALTHSFANEEKLTVRDYLIGKQAFGLDPELKLSVMLKKSGNDLDSFRGKVLSQECAVREAFIAQNNRFEAAVKAQSKEYRESTKSKPREEDTQERNRDRYFRPRNDDRDRCPQQFISPYDNFNGSGQEDADGSGYNANGGYNGSYGNNRYSSPCQPKYIPRGAARYLAQSMATPAPQPTPTTPATVTKPTQALQAIQPSQAMQPTNPFYSKSYQNQY
ncbi:hypothetical protein BJ875DRAFT_512541 [Amylocarpus encephaloides]|uniref:Uncharacterized protein n=1 Tax=Amylocarpus encephaloides TaxID=45428 RepID=A0A9P7YGR5_9HELO|nr:hypothetical protein BJ875DRAFT_512541 [Amylocarpus encephaloides]